VLKNSLRETGAEATPNSDILDPVAQEVAQATVSFSRAWKDELGTANAYWVRPDQVKKSAPTGQYLPRGSFYIEGRKNFVKNVKVELAVAIIDSKLLGRFRDSNREGVAMDSLELESSLIP